MRSIWILRGVRASSLVMTRAVRAAEKPSLSLALSIISVCAVRTYLGDGHLCCARVRNTSPSMLMVVCAR